MPVFPGAGDASVRLAYQDASGIVQSVDSSNPLPISTGLKIPSHDYISFSPLTAPATGDQTITYKVGGAGGTTVATVTLTFSGGALASVAQS